MKKILKSSLSLILALTIVLSSASVGLSEIDFGRVGSFIKRMIPDFSVKSNASTESYLVFTLNDDGASYSVTECAESAEGELVIPETYNGLPVTSIGECAFDSGSSLTSIVIPNSVVTINVSGFGGCSSLTSIYVDEGNANFSSVDGVLFNKDKTILVKYPAGKADAEYTIPEGVLSIGDYAFLQCLYLGIVTIPDSVINICFGAFACCYNLFSITIPESVTSIGESAFYECQMLASITIPDSVTNIGNGAFADCYNLVSITIPQNITSIPVEAFSDCANLREVSFSNSLVSIEGEAFEYCDSLHSIFYDGSEEEWVAVTIGIDNDILQNAVIHYNSTGHTMVDYVCQVCGLNTWSYEAYEDYVVITGYNGTEPNVVIPDVIAGLPVTEIGEGAFLGNFIIESVSIGNNITKIGSLAFAVCTNLESIQVDSENEYYISENGVLFNKDKTTLICYPTGTREETYVIPETVTTIDTGAFAYNVFLSAITIPGNVENINYCAFVLCYNLNTVNIENGVKNIGDMAFVNCVNLTSITIPDSVTSIGEDVFRGCYSLISVEIGNGVTNIGDYAFHNCDSFVSINVDENNTCYSSVDGVLFNKDKTTLVQYPMGKTNTSYEIPDAVTSIGDSAFYSCDNLTSVTIPDSVTTIGDYAFYNCDSLTSITIPDSVTSIGEDAFGNCDSLTSITIGNGVTSIGDNAFCNCYNLTSITIPNSVTTIGDYAFYNCDSLTSITIPNSVTSIGDNAFQWCDSLTSVTIGNGVTTIGDYAFYNCDSLTSITIPDSVTSIGDNAFRDCNSLTIITIPDSVTSIGDNAFQWCDSLTSVTIGNGVTSIGNNAFYNCYNLTSITIPNSVTTIGDYAFYNCDSLTSITIPDSVTSIGDSAFSSCSSLKYVFYTGSESEWANITIGDYNEPLTNATIQYGSTDHNYSDWVVTLEPTCTEEGSRSKTCFNCGDVVTEAIEATGHSYSGEWTIDTEATCTEEGSRHQTCSVCQNVVTETIDTLGHDYSPEWTIDKEATCTEAGSKSHHCSRCDSTTDTTVIVAIAHIYVDGCCTCCGSSIVYEYTIENDTVTITGYIGTDTDITIPSEIDGLPVVAIGESAFEDCTSLTSIEISDSVTSIGDYAFSDCRKLSSFKFGSGVTSIGDSAFYYCYNLTSLTIPNSVTSIGNSAFYNCDGLTEIKVPDSVITIGEDAFAHCDGLTSVIIGDGVTSISDNAFYHCESIISVTIGNSVTTIGDSVFSRCTSLTSIVIPDSVTSIGNYAFQYCDSLTSVTIPDSVTSIGNEAFYSCDGLTAITIPDSVITIGKSAFNYCKNLTSVEIGDGVTSIGSHAFDSCTNLTEIEIPNSVTSIGDYVFEDCTNLTSVAIGEGLTTIGTHVFRGCSSLTSINVNESNVNFSSVDGVLFNKDKTSLVVYPEGKASAEYIIPDSVTSIKSYAFEACTSLTSITIGEGVTSIGSWAFYNCKNLEKIYWNAKSVNDFYDSSNVFYNVGKSGSGIELVFGDTVERIPAYLCYISNSSYKPNIASITIGNKVTSIGAYAFYGCNNPVEIEIPDSVTSIGSYAFRGCSNLSSITIPDGITRIERNTFASCSSLTSVIIPDSVGNIGYYAFEYCSSLTSITIPESVTYIGSHAFSGCKGLEKVYWNARDVSDFTAYSDIFYNAGTSGSGIELVFGDTVESIPEYLCYVGSSSYRPNITSVVIGNNVTSIGSSAFYGCTNLTSVTIPASVTSIDESIFYDCTSLISINVDENNPVFSSVDGVLFNKDKTTLIMCPQGKTEYAIPDGVTTIGAYAFRGCINLNAVSIPDSVTSIAGCAFEYCDNLKSIIIPDSVTSIGNYAFYSCDSLTEIEIPDGVTSVGNYAFAYCGSLASAEIGDGVTNIGYYAFESCDSLSSVTIGNGITDFESGVFQDCVNINSVYISDLATWCCNNFYASDSNPLFYAQNFYVNGELVTDLVIPDGVTKIGALAFNNYEGLVFVTIPDSVTSIGEHAFSGTAYYNDVDNWENGVLYIGNHLIEADADVLNGSYTVKEGTKNIADYAFYHCESLTGIEITNSVTNIGEFAFYHCENLASVIIPESVTNICDYAFYCTNLTDVFYAGSKHDWANIAIGSYNTSLTDATIQYGSVDHNYGDWVVTLEPTCTEVGSQSKTCSDCGEAITETIEALGHDYSTEWTIDIAATCTENGSKSHHCSRCDSTTDVTTIAATGHVYGDWVTDSESTCTVAGSKHKTCSDCGEVVTETIEALGHDYSTEWTIDKAATCTEDGSKSHHCSRCDSKSEVTVIAATGHVYGDWIIDTEATVLSEGAKHRICSVCDNEEAQVIEKIEIDIETNTDYGLAVFTVVHAQTLEPISNAQIFISTENDGENTFTTDSNGQVSVVLPVGNQVVSAYAEGCLTRNLKVNIKSGVNEIPQIGLSELSTYDAEITSTQMTIEEIEEAGIDTSDPDNQHVCKYELKLEFEAEIDWHSFFYYMNDAGEIVGGGSSDSSGGGYWVSNSNLTTNSSGGYFYIPATEEREAVSVYPVSEYFYLIIRGEVRWLKEMFDVEMLVINNSLTDTLEDLTATLELSDGLSLATMVGDQQSLAQQIDHIAEGESKSVHWYVRGDKEGSYNLQARLQGTIMPFEETIDDLFIAENQLQVLAGSALSLHFEFPDTAYYDEDYPITITLTNTSDKTLYNISHMIQLEQGMTVYYSDGSSKTEVDTSTWKSSGVIREFNPGDKLIIETSVNIFFESEMMEREIQKYIGIVDDIEQLLNGFKAVKTAFDVVDKLSSCIEGCSKAMDDFIASAAESSDKMELFEELHDKISSLYTSYSTSGNKTFDAAVDLANSGLNASLNAITTDPDLWLANHSAEDIKGLLDDVSALENSIVSSENTSKKFDIFDSIRTAISAIPIRFALKNVVLTEDENNTTSIPWSYSVSTAGPQYFGVSNVSKYLISLIQAMGAEAYEETMPGLLQLIPGLDDPFNKEEAIKYIQATEDEIAQFKAKDATGAVEFKAWVERNEASTYSLRSSSISDDFTLSCDNETAVFEDGVLTFTGEGMISVTPQAQTGGTLYIEDSEGNLYTYVIEVVEEHTCACGEREVVISPTAEFDGFAVKSCTVCGDIMEIEPLAYSDCCEEHSFAEWVEDERETCTDSTLRSRCCSVCGFTETEVVVGIVHTFVDGVCSVCGIENPEEAIFDYEISDDSATITGCDITEGEVVIPDEIKGLPVTEIGSSAFEGSEDITSIVIPDSVTIIGDSAFENCDSLEYIFYPGSESDWENISIGENNTALKDAIIHYNSTAHNYEEKVDTEATCTEDGSKHPECTVCGYSLESEVVSALGHDYSTEWTIDKEATCTEDGSKSHHCSRCNSVTDATVIEAIGHIYGDWVITLEPTCAEVGSKSKPCSACVDVVTEAVEALGHDYSTEWTVDVEPTCTEEGSKSHHCLRCDGISDVTVIPAGHSFNDWVIDVEPTCTESGEKHHICSICDYSEDAVVAATGHYFIDDYCAECGTEQLFSYSINNNSVTITGYLGTDTDVVIPSVIEGLPVTTIGDLAFNGCSNLISVIIPKSVTNIGTQAFGFCTSLTSITIPNSVTNIGEFSFSGCDSLTSINVDSANQNYISVDGVLFNKDKTILIHYPAGKTATSYIISNIVTSIGHAAFYNCSNLTSITIPDGIASIGLSTFYGCDSLISISIPDSVTTIGDFAFYKCTSLTSITIPDSVTSIGDSVFYNCSALTNVYYLGLLSNWDNITIGSNNDCLTNASISHLCTYGDWVTNSEPTCTEEGLRSKTCVVCSEAITESLKATGHSYSTEWTIDIEATCTEDGSKSHHCIVCDNKTDITVIEVTGHCYSEEWTIDDEATCIKEGSKSHHCSVCGDKTDITVIAATGHNYEITDAVSSHPHTTSYKCSYCEDEKTKTTVSSGCIECNFTITTIDSSSYKLVSYIGTETDVVISATYNGLAITTISNSCFKGNETITSIEIEEGVTTIGSLAFMNCTSLEKVTIPASVTSIGTQTFYGFTGTIYCEYGSVAHKYAIDNKINYVINSTDEPEEPIQETVNTQIDYENFIIRTSAYACKDVAEILGLSESAVAVAEASYIHGNLELYGTGTVITVFDGNEYIGDFTLVVEGDVNGDSVCDVLDAMHVALVSNGHKTLDGAYAMAADSNSDDVIDVNDYQAVVNKAVS